MLTASGRGKNGCCGILREHSRARAALTPGPLVLCLHIRTQFLEGVRSDWTNCPGLNCVSSCTPLATQPLIFNLTGSTSFCGCKFPVLLVSRTGSKNRSYRPLCDCPAFMDANQRLAPILCRQGHQEFMGRVAGDGRESPLTYTHSSQNVTARKLGMAGNHRSRTLLWPLGPETWELGMAGNHRSRTLSKSRARRIWRLGMAGNHRSRTLWYSALNYTSQLGMAGNHRSRTLQLGNNPDNPLAGDGRESPLTYTRTLGT
jgi:hypothetical protein